MIKWRFVLRFAGLGSVVERSATKAAIAQASLSAARRGARSNVDHIAPEIAAAYTLGLQIDCVNGTKQLRGRGNRCGISALGSGGCAAGRGYM